MSFSYSILAVVLLTAMHLISSSYSLTEFDCEDGWEKFGTHCYYFVNVRQNFHDANRLCKSYGSRLVKIRDEVDAATISERAEEVFTQAHEYWIANGRENASMKVLDPGFECGGFWQPSEPREDRNGGIEEGEMAVSSNWDGRMRIVEASKRMPFVCRTPACPDDSFRCSDGICINDRWKCDGEYDCEDQSDESNCGHCMVHFKSNSGELDTNSTYQNLTVCQWIIQGEPGEVLRLEFEIIDLEPDVDVLSVYVGGPSLEESMLLENLTGSYPTGSKVIYSRNNFFILRLTTDGTVSRDGIKVTWSAVPELRVGAVTMLDATEDYQMLTSPFFDDIDIPMFMTKEWHIRAPEGQLITLEITHSNLKGHDAVYISGDGVLLDIPKEKRMVVVSSSNDLTLVINAEHMKNPRFKAKFKTGCDFTSSFYYAHLDIHDMPPDLNCVWQFSNSKNLSFTTSFNDIYFDDRDDYMKVFSGEFVDNDMELHLDINYTMTGVLDLGMHMAIQYFSNSLRPRNEIKATIASDCPNFIDHDNMTVTGSRRPGHDYNLNISCVEGYAFVQEEYYRPEMVIADCNVVGEWYFGSMSYTRYPTCQIVYCGIPDQISNGQLIGTGGNVTYGGTAQYACFNGFNPEGSDTVTCQANGTWTSPPRCIAEPCDDIPVVLNGSYVRETGDSDLPFGTVVRYECSSGFELVGPQQIVCDINGTWSHEAPTCRKKNCPYPVVEHAVVSSGPPTLFGDSIDFACDSGFVFNGTNSTLTEIQCGPDRTFLHNNLECVDVNECDDDPCEPFEVCVNRPGSHTCLCQTGYSGSPCRKTHNPYDHCTLCGADNDTYCCTCDEGYDLFTEDGLHGFNISSEETGLRDFDVYHINFTCVPKQCAMPSENHESGEPFVMTAKTIHHFEDELKYLCDFGYTLTGETTAKCNSSGHFEGRDATPSCQRLMCAVPTAGNELEVSRIPADNATVEPGATVQITCMKGDGTNSTIVKNLFCAPTPNNPNEFSLQGDSPECQRVDCRQPMMIAGANISYSLENTTYGASFEFACDTDNGFSVSGYSSQNDRTVTCMGSGRWDFGNLTCTGARCSDPQFYAGTTYTAPGGFGVDQEVYYQCEESTYTLKNDSVRVCEYNSGSTSWGGEIPVCVDERAPEIYCPSELEFDLYDTITLPVIEFYDNSGYAYLTQESGLLSGALVSENSSIVFSVTDGKQTHSCRIEILLRDVTPPTLQCVGSHVLINSGDIVNISQIVVASSDPDLLIFSHNQQPITGRPGTVVPVTVLLTKRNGLKKECGGIVEIDYPACTNASLSPTNAVFSNCRMDGDVYKCDIDCNDGYVLPDFNVSYTAECQDGVWTPSASFYSCHQTFPPTLSVSITEVFRITGNAFLPYRIDFDSCSGTFQGVMTSLIGSLSNVCGAASFELINFDLTETDPQVFTADMTIRITNLPQNSLSGCLAILLNNTSEMLQPNYAPADPDVCRTPWTIIDSATRANSVNEPSCDNNRVLHSDDSGLRCIPCGPGYYFSVDSCIQCSPGSYNPSLGVTTCQQCPYDGGITETFATDFITEEDCEEICPSGYTSSTGYVKDDCSPCVEDMYWQNAMICAYCPNSGSTKGVQAAVNDSYCYSQCPSGSYSLSGYEDCLLCPEHYYSGSPGSTMCTECPTDKYTISNGSSNSASCLEGAGLCANATCDATGTVNCTVVDHKARCNCEPGYGGPTCAIYSNPCNFDPCYNEGTCVPNGLSYTCDCMKVKNCSFVANGSLSYIPANPNYEASSKSDVAACEAACLEEDSCVSYIYFNTSNLCILQSELEFGDNPKDGGIKICDDKFLFSGDHCEVDLTNDCTDASCYELDFCKDLVRSTECVCPAGGAYQQPRCEPSADPCDDNPCASNARCVAYGNVRRVCLCAPGYTGDSCDTNIDECMLNPNGCLYDGECNDGIDGYSCQCEDTFDEDHCEVKGDLCASASCGDGDCFSDYHNMKAICSCADHFELPNENVTDSCIAIRYCDSSPCENNATCANIDGGFNCECLDGYEGSLCQLNIDDCSSSPCENEGVCQDRLNGYHCVCPPGFEGNTCAQKTVDCTAICNGTNTDSCENLILDYKCMCKAGFHGKNCSEIVMKCDNDPCEHNGNCTNLDNDFRCDCPEGWTGKSCGDIDDYCEASNPCQNHADCYNLKDRIYCSCNEGTAGSFCEVNTDVCGLFGDFACLHGECDDSDGSPSCTCTGVVTSCEFRSTDRIIYESSGARLISTQGLPNFDACENACDDSDECIAFIFFANSQLCQLRRSYELSDVATSGEQAIKRCQFDPNYSGKSCQLEKDHCYNKTCGMGDNVGQCILDKLLYKCDCEGVKNFEGPQCRTPVDVCNPNPCPGSSRCHEYKDKDHYLQPVCLCDADEVLSGTMCKKVYRDYDLTFPMDLQRNNFVTSIHGFYMEDEGQITISFWVACAGTPADWVLAIASPDEDPLDEDFEPFLKITNDHILFENDNISLTSTLDDDNLWHFISLSIQSDGRYKLQYDYRILGRIEDDSPQLNVSIPENEYLLVHLGQEFSGYISQVEVWKSIITANEVLQQIDNRFNIPQEDNLLLGWTLYSRNVLVEEVSPSSAVQALSVCNIPDTIATEAICPENDYPDKVPPVLRAGLTCEKELTLYLDEDMHQAVINDLNYRFSDGTGEGTLSSNIRGDVFSFGAHDIAVTSTDSSGNTGVCMTRTYVTPNTCNDTRPSEEFEYCDENENSVIIECPENQYPSIPVPRILTCGKLRSYNLDSMFAKPPKVVCGECLPITFSVTLNIVYTLPVNCPAASIQTLADEVESLVQTISEQKWNALCIDDECSNGQVTAVCSSVNSKEANVTIILNNLPAILNSTDELQLPLTPRELMLKLMEDRDDLDAQAAFNAELKDDDFSVEERPRCTAGHIISGDCCVECGAGSYHDVAMDICRLCPANYYTNSSGHTQCTPCPNNGGTLQEGSTSEEDCIVNCPAGQIYNVTTNACSLCPSNFYQDLPGQTRCKPCPPATGAESAGSTSVDECQDYCDPGTQLNNGICVPCMRGYYRRGEVQDQCHACPENTTTRNVSATGVGQCSIPLCHPGSFVYEVGLNTYECRECDYGTYQNEMAAFECNMCPDMYTTEKMGAVNESQCIFVCPAGKEVHPDNPGTCRFCDREKFRGSSVQERFQPCQNCTAGLISEDIGAFFANQCIIADCQAGSYLNSSNNICVPCDYGFYQPNKWQLSCEECDDNYSTESRESVNSSDCRFVCPPGEEELPTDLGNCHACPRGSYRNSSLDHRFMRCQNCTGDMTTSGTGAMDGAQCNIRICTAGNYRNATTNECRPCPKGQYQSEDLQDSCESCGNDYTTDGEGKSSSTDCIFICPEGQERVGETTTCRTCARGTYRNSSMEFDMCANCTASMTTDGTGATSSDQCHIKICTVGEVLSNDNSSCEACDYDFYQPVDQPYSYTLCQQCPDNEGTYQMGSDDLSDCEVICPPGYGYNSSIDNCTICSKGFYNNGNLTMRFMACEQCPTGLTTLIDEGATHIDNCSISDCPEGSYFNESGDCVLCPIGTYQPLRRQSECEDCPSETNTSVTGSTSSNDCRIYCNAGLEGEDGNCVRCQPNFYKAEASFGGCFECRGDVTSGTSRTSCSETFCDVGREPDGNGCTNCTVGFYKNDRGNNQCVQCPANTTTSGNHSSSLDDCNVVHCEPGYFSLDDENCEACHIGFYKASTGNENCTACPENTTTGARASTEEDDCDLVICPRGHYRNSSNQCHPCEQNYYQPERGSTSCLLCMNNKITEQEGSTDENDCKVQCEAGQKRNNTANACEDCGYGFYQNERNQVTCKHCTGNYTTSLERSTSEDDCHILCPAGYFRSTTSQCSPCQRGQYQNESNRDNCNLCQDSPPYDSSTFNEASTSADDCYPICPPGRYLDTGNKNCLLCEIGTYKTSSSLETTCTSCPTGNTTIGSGSSSRSECSYELCSRGYYRQEGEEDCQRCPFGEFQPNNSVAVTSCQSCPDGKTTLFEGASDEAIHCVTDCADGSEYNVTDGSCVPCPIGSYRARPMLSCTICPDGQSTLSTNSVDCVDSPGTPPLVINLRTYRLRIQLQLPNCGNRAHFKGVLKGLIEVIFSFRRRRFTRICRFVNCTDIVITFPVYCPTNTGITKRETGGLVTVDVTVPNIPEVFEDGPNRISAETVLQQSFLDLSPVQDILDNNQITDPPLVLGVIPLCDQGSFLSSAGVCVLCPEGEYDNVQTSNCTLCAKGSYSIPDRTACQMCPEGQTTQSAGSSDVSSCVLCPGGQYRGQGDADCRVCAKGSYSITNRTTCQTCPDGQTTVSTGADSVSSCNGECAFDSTLCGNGGTCTADGNTGINFCDCTDFYTGTRCQSPLTSEPDEGESFIQAIAISVAGGVLLLVILVIVGICVSMKRKSKPKKKRSISSDSDSVNDMKIPPLYRTQALAGAQPNYLMPFDPTMYQSEVIDMSYYQQQNGGRDQLSMS